MGVSMANIGNALANALGGNYVNQFNMEGRSYDVIPQVSQQFRFNPDALNQIYVSTDSGMSVPLATFVTIKQVINPNALTTFPATEFSDFKWNDDAWSYYCQKV